jgi:hypothetical protein
VDPEFERLGYQKGRADPSREVMNTILLMRAVAWEKKDSMGISMSSPVWERVEDWLRRGYEYGGGMELVAGYPETDTRTRHGVSINMSANPHECRLTYLPIQRSGEKTKMREWWKVGDLPFRGTTVFDDHPFDDRTVCRDVEVVVRIFRDFFDNHDLTESSLTDFISVWDAKPRS